MANKFSWQAQGNFPVQTAENSHTMQIRIRASKIASSETVVAKVKPNYPKNLLTETTKINDKPPHVHNRLGSSHSRIRNLLQAFTTMLKVSVGVSATLARGDGEAAVITNLKQNR